MMSSVKPEKLKTQICWQSLIPSLTSDQWNFFADSVWPISLLRIARRRVRSSSVRNFALAGSAGRIMYVAIPIITEGIPRLCQL